MIKITVKQLIEVANSGALRRYLALEKPVSVAWKNRKQVVACDEEIKLYSEKQLALAQKFGTQDPANSNAYLFDVGVELSPGEIGPQRKAFAAAMEELVAQQVDTIPGELVSVALLSGKLAETDLCLLEPFLTD